MNKINRAAILLDYLARLHGPARAVEISKALGLRKGTVSRLLSELEAAQFVAQDSDTQRFSLGLKVLELGLYAQSRLDLRSTSLPFMQRLRDVTGETVTLSMRIGIERVYIEQVQGKFEVRHVPELGKHFPLWVGGGGKVILSHLSEEEIEAVMSKIQESGVYRLTSGQTVGIERLRQELNEIRKRDFVVTGGEAVPSFVGVSAPIFDRGHRVVGAISVGGPLPRFGLEEGTRLGPSVSEAARNISLRLGDLRLEPAAVG